MSLMDQIGMGFALVAQWQSVGYLILGVTIGVIAGAIPGMSAVMAVALTLPFTFSLQPIFGILLLLGVYKGGVFGGSIPAILIKTPGTPASSATSRRARVRPHRPSRGDARGGGEVIFIVQVAIHVAGDLRHTPVLISGAAWGAGQTLYSNRNDPKRF